MTALVAVVLGLLAVVAEQCWLIYMVVKRTEAVAAEERRFLMNHLMSDNPQQFAMLQAAGRPDETVEAIAEARVSRPSPPLPLGL